MNRRSFLSLFGVTAAALAMDPERLLWVPGKKLISVPKVSLQVAGEWAYWEDGHLFYKISRDAFALQWNINREINDRVDIIRLQSPVSRFIPDRI